MTNKVRGTLYAIRKSVPVQYLSIWLIAGLVLGIIGARYNWRTAFAWGGETYTYEKAIPTCEPLQCEVDRRTLEVYQRDHEKYMEQSRIQAMLEMNLELQGMVYPELDETGKVR